MGPGHLLRKLLWLAGWHVMCTPAQCQGGAVRRPSVVKGLIINNENPLDEGPNMHSLLPALKVVGVALTAATVLLIAAQAAVDSIYFADGGNPEESDLAAAMRELQS